MSDTSLAITCRTWIRESKLLYDYRSTDFLQEYIEMSSGGCLALNFNTESELSESYQNDSIILKVKKLGNDYIILPADKYPLGEVISKTKNNLKLGSLLSEGTIFKIGRLFFKVKEIVLNTVKSHPNNIYETNLQEETSCRVCFSGTETPSNPLISVCSCTGSMKYTHLVCLQKWILSKAKVTKNHLHRSYRWKSLSCEICKCKLSPVMSYKESQVEIVKIPKPKGKYLVLEEMLGDEFCYYLHLLEVDVMPINIGRSTYCELKIDDMSVSKVHASIELVDNKFYIKDNYSKYGTLVLVDEPMIIRENEQRFVQVNNTFIILTVYSERSFTNCFRLCCKKSRRVAQNDDA